MMSNYRRSIVHEKSFCTFPTTKLKNIFCVFCRHQFYVRDLSYLKGIHLPLLLTCGHAACQQCVVKRADEECPTCKISVRSKNGDPSKPSNLLPVNTYVVGLMSVVNARPANMDDPDLSFVQPIVSRTVQKPLHQKSCARCGGRDVLSRLPYHDEFYCFVCACQIHKTEARTDPDECHILVMLKDCTDGPVFKIDMCPRHHDVMDYYCNQCEETGCCHCMIQQHNQHPSTMLSNRNKEHMEEFDKVHNKLAETMQRLRQAKKKLNKALVFPDELQNSSNSESLINQHFVYLHGVLQNIEKRMIDELHEQQNYTIKNLNDVQRRINEQQEQVQNGLLMASAMKEMSDKLCLEDEILKLERLADVPCYLVQDPIVENENIKFSADLSVVEKLEKHCGIEVPKVTGFKLLAEETLPEDYEFEPLDEEELAGLRAEKFGLDSTIKITVPQPSLPLRREKKKGLRTGTQTQVHVSWVENPSLFYVRQATDEPQASNLQTNINYFVNNRKPPLPTEVNVDEIYAVQIPSSKFWYRGRVTAINTKPDSPDTYEIFGIDRGKMENEVTKMRLRCLPTSMTAVPATLIKCGLHGIEPKDGEWTSEARNEMLKLIKYRTNKRGVIMYIVEPKEDICLVDICTEQSNDLRDSHISVAETLAFSGHGISASNNLINSISPPMRNILRESLDLDAFCQVQCSHIETPDCIYVQKAGDNLLNLHGLINEMSAIYNEAVKHKALEILIPSLEMPCAIEKSKGFWYRGIVTGVPAPRTVQVFLLDFGSTITTDCEKIRILSDKYMTSPGQAIKVSLVDVKPREGDKWTDEAIEFTKKIIDSKSIRIFAFEKSSNGYRVGIYVNDDENFAAMLATNDFAVSTGSRSSGMFKCPNDVQALETNFPKPQIQKLRNSRSQSKRMRKQAKNWRNKHETMSSMCETTDKDHYRIEVIIIRVESPNEIYLAQSRNETSYEKMFSDMQKFYNNYKEAVRNDDDWELNKQCAVYRQHDKMFHRGKIVSLMMNDKRAIVNLYDIATEITVPIDDLRAVNLKFWKHDTRAFKAKLGEILPCGGSSDWLESSCQKFKDFIHEDPKAKFYISKISEPEVKDLHVELMVERTTISGPFAPKITNLESINEMLVNAGHAIRKKQYGKSKVLALDLKREILNTGNEQKNENFKSTKTNGSINVKSDDDSESSCSDSTPVSQNFNEHSLSSNDENVTSWPQAEKITNDKFEAVASNVDYDCFVYLHPIQNVARLKNIENTLTEGYRRSKTKPKDFTWKKDDLCIVEYHDDKKWCRGQVKEVLENSEETIVRVELIDYGSVEDCKLGELRKRLKLTDVPRQSTKCAIYGLRPDTPDGKFTIEDLDKIHTVVVDQRMMCYVRERTDDHLVVSIQMLTPNPVELMPHLIHDLNLSVRNEFDDDDDRVEDDSNISVRNKFDEFDKDDDSRSDDREIDLNDETNDDDFGVIIEGYIDHPKFNEIDLNDNVEVIENNQDDENEKDFENETVDGNENEEDDENEEYKRENEEDDENEEYKRENEEYKRENEEDDENEEEKNKNEEGKGENEKDKNEHIEKNENKIFGDEKNAEDTENDEEKNGKKKKRKNKNKNVKKNEKDDKNEEDDKTEQDDKNPKDKNTENNANNRIENKILEKQEQSADDIASNEEEDDDVDSSLKNHRLDDSTLKNNQDTDSTLKNNRENDSSLKNNQTIIFKNSDDDSIEKNENNESSTMIEGPTVIFIENPEKSNSPDDLDGILNDYNDVFSVDDHEDPVLSGTANFSPKNESRNFNKCETSYELETISLPDFLDNDELVASTPFNESLVDDYENFKYKRLVIPDDVVIVKAEVSSIGYTICWLHLLDNKNSKIITECCELYEDISVSMLQAEEQPILENIYRGSPCCAKFIDKEWYRCEVLDCESPCYVSSDTVHVFFIDWGNDAVVRRDEIRTLKEEWMKAPIMGLRCTLSGISVSPNVDDKVIVKKLHEAYYGSNGQTTGRIVYVEIKNRDSESASCVGNIYSDENCTELIYESLIKEGLFVTKAKTKID